MGSKLFYCLKRIPNSKLVSCDQYGRAGLLSQDKYILSAPTYTSITQKSNWSCPTKYVPGCQYVIKESSTKNLEIVVKNYIIEINLPLFIPMVSTVVGITSRPSSPEITVNLCCCMKIVIAQAIQVPPISLSL